MSDLCARNCARRPFGSRMGEVSYWYGLPSWARRAIRDQVLTGDGPLPQQFTYFWIVVVQAHEFRSETKQIRAKSPRPSVSEKVEGLLRVKMEWTPLSLRGGGYDGWPPDPNGINVPNLWSTPFLQP
jgi:hypothetical protein